MSLLTAGLTAEGAESSLAPLPMVSFVVPFLVNQNLYYRILSIKLVNQKKGNYNGDSR